MTRRWVAMAIGTALAAGGLTAGLTVALHGSANPASPGTTPTAASYGYYQSVMGQHAPGPMMGGWSYDWMMGQSGYEWMMGGVDAPGWMTGGTLPPDLSAEGDDPGTIMGALFGGAPGLRLSAAQATRLGETVPAGAVAETSARRLVFSGEDVSYSVLASPSMPQEDFEIAGIENATVIVPRGAHVTIQFVNADTDMAHGFVIAASADAAASQMPMMTAAPAFPGAALWFLGEATSAGMQTRTLSFTANAAGTYQYFCPVPGHAQEGMDGTFIVQPSS
jgi:rusticyanin